MATNGHPLSVLLVEDNPGDADLVREWLSQEDTYTFELSPVTTLQQARVSLTLTLFDAILLDLSLPDSQGIETLSLLRESSDNTPILVFSGSASDEIRLAAYRAGAQDFIPKSEDAGRLLARGILYAVERHRMQMQRHYLDKVMAANPDAVLVLDANGLVQFANEAAANLLGRPHDTIIGQPLDFAVGTVEPQEIEFTCGQGVRVGEIRTAALELHRKPALLVTIRDQTEYRKMQQQLRQSQKMEAIGRLAGGVAHDFNNLLTVINGYVEILEGDPEASEEQKSMLACVREAGDRASALTDQLLAFGRRSVVKSRPLDLNSVITGLEKLVRRLIGEDIDIQVLLCNDTRGVMADPTHLEQIIMNLCINARDAMTRGGRLVIETEPVNLDDFYLMHSEDARELEPGNYIRMSVSDTGTGMDPSIVAQIFEPFFTTKEQGRGTGLGLATVYGIVKQMNGHITCYSEVGVGTQFSIYLPAVIGASPLVGTEEPPTITDLRGNEVILLVEDDAEVRLLMKRALEKLGYTVLVAADGTDGVLLARATRGQIHLLLTDVILPKIGGSDLAAQVLQPHPEAKVLFISGYTNDTIVRHGILATGTNFLQKPFTPSGLLRRVREVLDQREPRV